MARPRLDPIALLFIPLMAFPSVPNPPRSSSLPRWLQAWLRPQNGIALLVLGVSGLVVGYVQQSELNLFTIDGWQQLADRWGGVAPLVYILVLALAVVISHIPEVPLALAAGAVWGAVPAGIYSVIGAFIGGLIAYFLGRSLGRSALQSLTGKVIYFTHERGERYLGWVLFVTRLLPIFSFDLMSYAAGVSGLSLRIYAVATLVGMIPPSFALTYMGEALTLSPQASVAAAIVFLAALIGLPWGIRRHNWLGLRDVIRIE